MQFEPISGSWDEPYWERPESSFLNLEVFISYLFKRPPCRHAAAPKQRRGQSVVVGDNLTILRKLPGRECGPNLLVKHRANFFIHCNIAMNGLPAKRAKTQPAPDPSPVAKHWTSIFAKWFPGYDDSRYGPDLRVHRKHLLQLFAIVVEACEDQAAQRKTLAFERMVWTGKRAWLEAGIQRLQRDVRRLEAELGIKSAPAATDRGGS